MEYIKASKSVYQKYKNFSKTSYFFSFVQTSLIWLVSNPYQCPTTFQSFQPRSRYSGSSHAIISSIPTQLSYRPIVVFNSIYKISLQTTTIQSSPPARKFQLLTMHFNPDFLAPQFLEYHPAFQLLLFGLFRFFPTVTQLR